MSDKLSHRERLRGNQAWTDHEANDLEKKWSIREKLARWEFRAADAAIRVAKIIDDEENSSRELIWEDSIQEAIELFLGGIQSAFPHIWDLWELEEELSLATSQSMANDMLSRLFSQAYWVLQEQRDLIYSEKKKQLVYFIENNPIDLIAPNNINRIHAQQNWKEQLESQLNSLEYAHLLIEEFITQVERLIKQCKKWFYDTKIRSYDSEQEYLYNIPSVRKLKIWNTANELIRLKKKLIHESHGLSVSNEMKADIESLIWTLISWNVQSRDAAINSLKEIKDSIENTLPALKDKKRKFTEKFIKWLEDFLAELETLNSKIKSIKCYWTGLMKQNFNSEKTIGDVIEIIYQWIRTNTRFEPTECEESESQRKKWKIIEETLWWRIFIDNYLHLVRSMKLQSNKIGIDFIQHLKWQRKTLIELRESQKASIEQIKEQIKEIEWDIEVFYIYISTVTSYLEGAFRIDFNDDIRQTINKFCLTTFRFQWNIKNETLQEFMERVLIKKISPYTDEDFKKVEEIEEKLAEYRKNCERFLSKLYRWIIPKKSEHLDSLIEDLSVFFQQIKK